MSWNPNSSLSPASRLWRTLAFRLTAGYALAGLFLVTFAIVGLYLVLVSELEKAPICSSRTRSTCYAPCCARDPTTRTHYGRKLSWNRRRGDTNNFIFACCKIESQHF